MKIVLFTLFCASVFISHAQKIEKFFDYRWHECEPNAARFYAVINKTDSGWHRNDYFIHEGSLQMEGVYEDEATKIPNGLFYYFHANGKLSFTGKYVHGKKEGLWLGYHPDGMMADSGFYVHDNIVGNYLAWYPNGFPRDSAMMNADGSGTEITWFDDGTPASAGKYSAGKKATGKWQFFHYNGKLSALETYTDGKLINKEYFDEDGNMLNDTTNKDRPAEFPGGLKAWQKYLVKKLYFPEQYKITNADKAVVGVTFTIDQNGKITDAFVSTPFYPDFDKIALLVIKKSPDWLPGIQHNRKINYRQQQAVFFSQE